MVVYKITNLINGKSYIGQTVKSLKDRWIAHCTPKSGCLYLSNAIKKYGAEAFEIKVLARCNSLEEMNHREAYYINIFNTLVPNGYNLMTGGGNSRPSEFVKIKRSKSRIIYELSGKRKPVSAQTRLKLSIAGKFRKLSLAQKEKLYLASIKSVFQYSKDGLFIESYESIMSASIKCSIDNSDIVKCCLKKRRLAGGYQWSYEKLDYLNPARPRKPHPPRGPENAPNTKRVALVDKFGKIITVYSSGKRAAQENNCSPGMLSQVCNGKRKTVKGMMFIYI